MRKARTILAFFVVAALLMIFPIMSAQAYDLSGWKDVYDPHNANTETSFGFSNGRHMDGNVLYYYWADQQAKDKLGSALAEGVGMWDGMIIANETTDPQAADITISYDDDINAEYPAVTIRYGSIKDEIRPGQGDAEIIVHYEPANSTDTTNMQMMGHELGHLWDIDDLYTYGLTNLDSMYSQLYVYDEATRQDMNAMYIAQDNPWFLDENNKWRHYLSPGVWVQNDFLNIDGFRYYFGADYGMVTGWQDIANNWYYFNPSGQMQIGWQLVDGCWHYFSPEGIMLTGWQFDSDNLDYYFDPNGQLLLGWQEINGTWYYLDPTNGSGAAATGWKNIDNQWYYFDPSPGLPSTGSTGSMVTGWQYDSDNLDYYFDTNGQLLLGWQEINGAWYYLDPTNGSGAAATGWKNIDNQWYYFDPSPGLPSTGSSGSMVTSWQNIDGNWYYFNPDGQMLTNWQEISNNWYYFDSDGQMLLDWQCIDGQWYYFDTVNESGALMNVSPTNT